MVQKAAKIVTKIVWGVGKSIMTMSVDKGLLEAGFSAAEMTVEKARQTFAKKYADKFAAFASLESNVAAMIEGDSGFEVVEQQLQELWRHLVVGDGRWETHASFSMMVTQVILKVTSTANEESSKQADDLVLWCLKGSGGEGGDGGEAGYEGLLSLMTHGDPKSAKDRDVRSVSLALSNWWVLMGSVVAIRINANANAATAIATATATISTSTSATATSPHPLQPLPGWPNYSNLITQTRARGWRKAARS